MRRRRAGACALGLGIAGLMLWISLPGSGGVSRAAAEGGAEVSPQTDASVPAREVLMIGATPNEAGGGSGETWGLGNGRGGHVLVRYTQGSAGEGAWTLGPSLQDESEQPLTGFVPDAPQAFRGAGPSPLAGQMTSDGAGVLVGFVNTSQRVLLVREPGNPGNAFRQTKPVPEADLGPTESLFGDHNAPMVAPLDEEGGHAGAFVVPVLEHGADESGVLHWNGETQQWTREQIEKPATANPNEFHVLGIAASSPTNAWLIAQLSEGTVGLFRRHVGGGEPVWQPLAIKPGGEAGEALTVPLGNGTTEKLTIPGAENGQVQTQVLTVTDQGVWVDGERPTVQASTTLFLKPQEGTGFTVTSWCAAPRAPAPAGSPGCQKGLPQALPSGPSRSFAWSSSAPFGERVITGLPQGVSLRLAGDEFTRVEALGGSVGADYGAAFSSPREGWLGAPALPVHLTTAPTASRLTQWPAAFRYPLLAIAPEPGQPVGALSSGAVAVGDRGQVARYHPGVGWLPEALLNATGKANPRLRAVAWPTPNRVFAVGDGLSSSQTGMWLWRGETGLWEPDPAEPVNFRGNLLGIAFDPGNPTRGFAVGETGVLLRYGKSWSQDAYPGEPPCSPANGANAEEAQRCSTWADASFTSIAFAGSQAIVAYRVLPNRSTARYDGGLIVNDGSGWHIDKEAAAAMGAGVPWAVGALPDGGAAFEASGSVFEREGPGAPWHAAATPLPGTGDPGSLAMFREGGAVRVVTAGAAPDTFEAESQPEAPPGSPPTLTNGYPLASGEAVLRQTASGWSDELHELNDARAPEGNWVHYDTPYEPDATDAILVDPSGAQGWAVGGNAETGREPRPEKLDTSEVARYRDGASAPGRSAYAIASEPEVKPGEPAKPQAAFAIGGNAQCAAPCADHAAARIGPDVWLSSAVTHAQQIPGVQAFFYTGPRLVDPRDPNSIAGHKESADAIDYGLELARYKQVLSGSALPAYVAGTHAELDEGEGEGTFVTAFEGFPAPFAKGEPECGGAPGCQEGYYMVEPGQGQARVIVLDTSTEVEGRQAAWLRKELEGANAAKKPAIVVGNANIAAEVAAHNHPGAEAVASILDGAAGNTGIASAYFYDSPEENVRGSIGGVPTFGSGTLGYVNYQSETPSFNGAGGFLLAEVEYKQRDGRNKVPVEAKLIPNIEELALEAKDGLLLQRSKSALFAALARRPRAGTRSVRTGLARETDPYVPIPANCVGATCSTAILPEYEFVSSNTQVGDFVEPNLAVANDPRAVLLGPGEEPIRDSKSGLFCALNKGETTVTIRTGGLAYSLPVTVQAGSVRRPCGTTKLNEPPSTTAAPVPPPTPAAQPSPAGAAPTSIVSLPPLPAPPVTTPAAVVKPPPPPQLPAFVPLPSVAAPVFAAVPPPVPTPARPTPPSGTSAVTQPIEAAEKEEEEEEATESVSNQAVAYRSTEYESPLPYLLGVVTLAAFAGAAIRRPRRGRREVRVAPATVSAMRAQRRVSGERRRRP